MVSLTVLRESTVSARVLAVMSYLGILSLVPLVVSRKNSYVQFHARQGIVLWIWELLAVYTLLLPVMGTFFFQLSVITCLVLSAVGLVSVLLGRAWRLPLIGFLAEKL